MSWCFFNLCSRCLLIGTFCFYNIWRPLLFDCGLIWFQLIGFISGWFQGVNAQVNTTASILLSRQPCSLQVQLLTRGKSHQGNTTSLWEWAPMVILHCPCFFAKLSRLCADLSSVSPNSLESSNSIVCRGYGISCSWIPEAHGESGLLHAYFTHPFSRSCSAPWISLDAYQPCGEFQDCTSFSPRGYILPISTFQCLISKDMFRVCQSTWWSSLSWWEKRFLEETTQWSWLFSQ